MPHTNYRYFVDERVGCVAVRDRQHTNFHDHIQSLNADTKGVVKYWLGYIIDKKLGWTIRPEDLAEALALCDKLNAGDLKDSQVEKSVPFGHENGIIAKNFKK